jgi:large subunit ribosomal protein L31
LNAPHAGRNALEIAKERVDEVVLVTEAELEEAFRLLYSRAKLAVEPAGAASTAALIAGKDRSRAGRARGAGCLRGQRFGRNRLCYPGFAMKTGIHPDYVLANVTCSCGNTFQTRSTKPELHVEICSNCHPFYTGKQKLMDTGGRVERFQRRLERAGGARRG